MPTAREVMQRLVNQGITTQTELVKRTVQELGISNRRAHYVYHSVIDEVAPRPPKPIINGGMTRQQFLSKYDVNTKSREAIRRGLETLIEKENPNEDDILEDAQFRTERCGDPNAAGWRGIASEPEFLRFQFKVGEKVFWTTPRTRQWALESVSKAREV